MKKPTAQTALRGRPRNPEMEGRVFDAAIHAYGERGWEGFTFELIARTAGVGKNALYRRWPTKGTLLREVLADRWMEVEGVDTGTLEGDLRALCHMLFAHLTGPLGKVGLQLQLDIVRHEVVAEAVAGYSDKLQHNAREIVRRAINRQEIPPGTSTALVMNIISGAVMSRVSATPLDLRDEMITASDQYIEELVRLVSRGLGIAT